MLSLITPMSDFSQITWITIINVQCSSVQSELSLTENCEIGFKENHVLMLITLIILKSFAFKNTVINYCFHSAEICWDVDQTALYFKLSVHKLIMNWPTIFAIYKKKVFVCRFQFSKMWDVPSSSKSIKYRPIYIFDIINTISWKNILQDYHV